FSGGRGSRRAGISTDRSKDSAWQEPRPPVAPAPPSGEYRWPIRMVWLLMAVVFFTAGGTKLRRGGLEWITSSTFATILVSKHYDPDPPIVDWGLTIAQIPALTLAMAAGSVLLELSMPLALFSRRARAVLPATLFLMQLGI